MEEQKATETTFEALLARLQEIVRLLEQDGVPLEESLKLYEEGLHLTRQCSLKIEDARLRIEKIEAGAK
jgi:exodeoxyribonuclease VII small subunit